MASIVKRNKKDGPKYFVVYRVDHKQVWKLAGSRRSDAERLKTRIESELHLGIPQIEDIGFKDFADKFLEAHSSRVSTATMEGYKQRLERAIAYFGNRRLKTISAIDIETYISLIQKEGRAPLTVDKYIKVLKLMLKRAVQFGYLHKSPGEHIAMPKIIRREMDFLTPKEIKELINNTDKQHQCMMMVVCYTGMRQGELLGLQWGDIDFKNNRIFIKRSWRRDSFGEPKSKFSVRSISIPVEVTENLQIHKLYQTSDLSNNPYNLVFPNFEGNPMDVRNLVRRIFEPALQRAGLRRVRFHDLRHSYAAALISAGENIKWIQKQMGHSSIMITMDTYGHLLPDIEKQAPERLQKALIPEEEKSGINRVCLTSV